MNLLQWKINSALGEIYILASPHGLRSLYFHRPASGVPVTAKSSAGSAAAKILIETEKQLTEYFAGQRRHFDLPLEAEGTDFQKRVWGELKKIPYGKTYSYRELAKKIKNEKATRAVGSANGKNPLSIIVPCHRVIAADGSLGGYSGGLPNKVKLLELERGHSRAER